MTAILMGVLYLLIECVFSCKQSRRITTLTIENETLKKIILRNADQIFVSMLKNGNDFENEDSD